MGRRIPRVVRPLIEEVERRELLSAITDLIAASSIAAGRAAVRCRGGHSRGSQSQRRQ